MKGRNFVLLWMFFGFQLSHSWAWESFNTVRAKTESSEGILYDRKHRILHESRIVKNVQRLKWVNLRQISLELRNAVVQAEDRRFTHHSGVDWKALISASAGNLFRTRQRGASTISMQLVSFLDERLSAKKKRRGYLQKWKQIQAAMDLEKHWSKDQIFEAYLNLAPFRGELEGIAAASYGMFGKAPDALTRNESYILAVLLRSPSATDSEVVQRACALGKGAKATCDEIAQIIQEGALRGNRSRPKIRLAPHLANRWIQNAENQVTLDREIQVLATAAVKRQALFLQSQKEKHVQDAAALVLDNASGEVLAYVGGPGETSSAPYVDGIQAFRQAGSTLKPFLYALSLDRKYLTAGSYFDDSPVNIMVTGGVYRPENYDHEFHGKDITLRIALASSLNIPAVQTLNLLGVDSFLKKLKELGFRNLKEADFYGPSLALGSVDVSLWDLTNAYRVLANRGRWSEALLQQPHSPSHSINVFSPEASFIISDILSDRESRSLTFGLENSLSLKFWSAAKTGTSKDMKDNWCIGFSERYTVGVWVGNFSGEPMRNVSGVTGAAPIWSEIMRELHKNLMSSAPQPPEKVVLVGPTKSGKNEWYIRGTEPVSGQTMFAQNVHRDLFAKIIYPVDGMIIAIDPDIPIENQKVVFKTNVPQSQIRWFLNGVMLPPQPFLDEEYLKWSPTVVGNYKLSIRSLDQTNDDLHSIYFSVR